MSVAVILAFIYFVVGIFRTDGFLELKQVWFIFEHGNDGSSGGGAGDPGQDLKDGIDAALTSTSGAFLFKDVTLAGNLFDDKGSEGIAKDLARKAADNPNVIAVVGHLSSTIMLQTMNIYPDHDLPVIMPVPTNPIFTDEAFKRNKHIFLRMPPPDTKQAKVASDFILSHHEIKNIAVIRDADNDGYSRYLAETFKKNVRDRLSTQPDGLLSDGQNVVFEAALGGTSSGAVSFDELNRRHIGAFFFREAPTMRLHYLR